VYPKLFRRSVTFFREHAGHQSFCEWLRDASGADDELRVGEDGAWRRLVDHARRERRSRDVGGGPACDDIRRDLTRPSVGA
jgi:hypothetical protein